MKQKGITFFFVALGMLLVFGSVFLMSPTPVQAQCGSQASSCKDCHESQGQDPVNNDGTAWHTGHAFGDFCYLCHAGNNQATDISAAHLGLVAPLADINANCASCHPDDTQARAQVYATVLGQEIGTGGAAAPDVAGDPATAEAPAATDTAPEVMPAAVVPAADMVDYSQRYDEVALGEKPANVGNIIMIVLIVAMVMGAGVFIARREGWVKISFQETKQIKGSYPADVVDLVPELARLKPAARKDLRRILSKPATAAELFSLVAKLSKKEE